MADETYSEAETKQRMEAAIRRAHKIPHTPTAEIKGKRGKSPKRKAKKASK